jgi:DNA polymerase-3 subunit epsilon
VLDTVALARRVLDESEVPDRKLSTLASYFHAPTPPCHRALGDARATAAVLHGLIGRLAATGVRTLAGLCG